MVKIVILISLGMTALLLLLMLVFGLRGLGNRRMSPSAMLSMLAPIALLIVLGFILGDWSRAGVYAVAIALVGTFLAMALTGLRGMFS